MKIKTLILITLTSIASSCKINGSFQGLYSYYDKTKSQAPELFIYHSNLNNCNFNETVKNKIIITTGKSLKQCIPSEDTIVYIWSPNCTSAVCYDVSLLQQYCTQKNINLLVVAEYYDLKKMKTDYDLKNPIFGIDTNYYNTNLTSKYCERFYTDLINQKDIPNKLLYFENSIYINSYASINDIK